jgi:hypothetical protein
MAEIVEGLQTAKEKKKERAKLIKELRDKSTPVVKNEVLTVTPPTLVKTKRYTEIAEKEETTKPTRVPRKASPVPSPIELTTKQEPLPSAPRTQKEVAKEETTSDVEEENEKEESPIELAPKVAQPLTDGEKLLRVNNQIMEFENVNTRLCTIRPTLSFGEQQKVQDAIRENIKQLQILRREKGRIERAIKLSRKR